MESGKAMSGRRFEYTQDGQVVVIRNPDGEWLKYPGVRLDESWMTATVTVLEDLRRHNPADEFVRVDKAAKR